MHGRGGHRGGRCLCPSSRRYVFSKLSAAGFADCAGMAAHRHDEPDLLQSCRSIARQAVADHVFQQGSQFLLDLRSEEHTSELQSLMRISYAVFCLKKKKKINITQDN